MTVVHSPPDVVAVIRARRLDLGLNHLELEDRAGLQQGYMGKIEACAIVDGKVKPNTRRLTLETAFWILGALGLRMDIVAADTAPAPGNALDARRQAILEPHLLNWHLRRLKPFTCETARLGGIEAQRRRDPARRSELGRAAALARWRKRCGATTSSPPTTPAPAPEAKR